MAKLSPVILSAQFINGIPASGAKLFSYAAGSSTKQTTYTGADGLTPQTNPIILDSRGEPTQPIWLTEGLSYKFVFTASTDSDPPVSPIWDIDNVTGINDASLTIDQWLVSGVTPTYVSATQFTLPGDQTTAFEVGRRIKATVTAGTVYGTITASVFGALTTVTVFMDGSSVLDSGLSAVQYGILTPTNSSIPKLNLRSGDAINESISTVASATTPDIWTNTSNNINYTGTTTATGFAAAPQAGVTRTLILAGAASFTAGANMLIDGVVSFTGAAGDEVEVTAVTTTQFRLRPKKYSGLALVDYTSKKLAQSVTSQSGTVATGTTLLPFDNTIPQITEGDQYLSLAITPTNASSTLEIAVTIIVASSVVNNMGAALFQDATANALAAAGSLIATAGGNTCINFTYIMTAGTTSATTFRVRAGGNLAGTTTFNGGAGVQIYGGVMASRITIKEYLP
jgi:hypothetical protein